LGKNESGHFLSPSAAEITWSLKGSDNTDKDYEHFGPPFILNVERLLAKIRNLKYRYLPDETLFPTEINQYDPWVIREALHNCIAHQDYALNGKIYVIEKLDDELIFSNMGSFIPGNIETVIRQDSPSAVRRNPFLVGAMVNLNMIDDRGGGIKKMFRSQMERFFPLPDYDLTQLDKVIVKIKGRILDKKYTQLLIRNRDVDLSTVMLLDKVQKHIRVSKEEHKFLKSRKLVEGRYPNLIISSHVAVSIGEKARYIRNKGFDDRYYIQIIKDLVEEFGSANRRDIDELILDRLPAVLTGNQKKKKIGNLLYKMSKKLGILKNTGSQKFPVWIVSNKQLS